MLLSQLTCTVLKVHTSNSSMNQAEMALLGHAISRSNAQQQGLILVVRAEAQLSNVQDLFWPADGWASGKASRSCLTATGETLGHPCMTTTLLS